MTWQISVRSYTVGMREHPDYSSFDDPTPLQDAYLRASSLKKIAPSRVTLTRIGDRVVEIELNRAFGSTERQPTDGR